MLSSAISSVGLRADTTAVEDKLIELTQYTFLSPLHDEYVLPCENPHLIKLNLGCLSFNFT